MRSRPPFSILELAPILTVGSLLNDHACPSESGAAEDCEEGFPQPPGGFTRQPRPQRADCPRELAFGRGLRGPNATIARLTRPNSLFLSAAAQNDHQQLSSVFAYFRSMRGLRDIAVQGRAAALQVAEQEPDPRVIDFLATVDTGVIGYRRSETEIPEKARPLHRELSAVIKKVLNSPVELELDEDDTQIMIELAHRGQGGRQVYLELQRESAGTRRLLVLLGLAFRALDEGGSLLVDELDASLPSHACEAVLQLFCSPKTNPDGAQLVATTHNTSLMNSPALRRDQIWFTQKDKDGATQLYPLTDIRTRRGDDFESGCLQGRCGAVSFDDPLSTLGSTN